jgi:hypothetical protein
MGEKNTKNGRMISLIPQRIKEVFPSVHQFYRASNMTWTTVFRLAHGGIPGREHVWEEVCRLLECQPGDVLKYEE